MAVTTNADLIIVKASQMLGPAISAQPLKSILQNTNWLYASHRPQAVSFAPMCDFSQDISCICPIKPSADGFQYRIYIAGWTDYNGTIDIVLNTGNGDGPTTWTNVITDSAAVTAGNWFTYEANFDCAAGEDRIQLQADAGAGNDYLISHVLIVPNIDTTAAPLAAPYGATTSGFVPYDDALIDLTNAPVNTEHLDRAQLNATKIRLDRYAMVASLIQDDGSVSTVQKYTPPTVAPQTIAATDWHRIGRATMVLPFQRGVDYGSGNDQRVRLYAHCLASVSGGTTSDLIRVVITPIVPPSSPKLAPSSSLFDADGAMQTAEIKIELDGMETAQADVEISVKSSNGTAETYLHAFALFWRPAP